MPAWVNILVQIIAGVGQITNFVIPIVPPKWQYVIAGGLAGVQAIVGAVASFYNPDGQPAHLPWKSA